MEDGICHFQALSIEQGYGIRSSLFKLETAWSFRVSGRSLLVGKRIRGIRDQGHMDWTGASLE